MNMNAFFKKVILTFVSHIFKNNLILVYPKCLLNSVFSALTERELILPECLTTLIILKTRSRHHHKMAAMD